MKKKYYIPQIRIIEDDTLLLAGGSNDTPNNVNVQGGFFNYQDELTGSIRPIEDANQPQDVSNWDGISDETNR